MSDRESITDRLIGAVGDGEDPRAAQFVRGLALGALVGAAIAGSAIWQRRQARSIEPQQVGDGAVPNGDEAAEAAGPESA